MSAISTSFIWAFIKLVHTSSTPLHHATPHNILNAVWNIYKAAETRAWKIIFRFASFIAASYNVVSKLAGFNLSNAFCKTKTSWWYSVNNLHVDGLRGRGAWIAAIMLYPSTRMKFTIHVRISCDLYAAWPLVKNSLHWSQLSPIIAHYHTSYFAPWEKIVLFKYKDIQSPQNPPASLSGCYGGQSPRNNR